jgi:hypothetical protein
MEVIMAEVDQDVAVTEVGKVSSQNGMLRDVQYFTIHLTEDGYIEIMGKYLPASDEDKYLGVPQMQSPTATPDDYRLEAGCKFRMDQDTAEALGTALLSYATAYGIY